jgi:hypothetical protein
MNGIRKSQRGVTLSGLLMAAVVIGIVVMLAAKVAPDVIEYFQIMQSIKEITADPAMKTATVADIRKAYEHRAIVERIENVKPADLDISKDGNDIVLSFSYERKIPLLTNISLLIDFEGSSSSAK